MSTFNPIFYYNLHSKSPLNAALLAAYKFENNANDSSVNALNGTTGTSLTYSSTNAVNGLAAQCITTTNSRITLPIAENKFSFTTGVQGGSTGSDKPFSVKANIFPTQIAPNSFPAIIVGKYRSGNNNNTSEWLFYLRPITNTLTLLLLNKVSGVYIGASTNSTIAINTKHNVIATYDGSGIWTGIKLYVNGNLMTVAPLNSGTGYTSMGITTVPAAIGNAGGGNSPFVGTIDELYLFNGVLTQSQINTLQTQYYPNF